MKCKYCNEEIDYSKLSKYASGDFCSKLCARNYSRSKIDKTKLKNSFCCECKRPIKVSIYAHNNIKCEYCKPKREKRIRFSTKDILNGLHPTYTSSKLKKRLFEEGYKEVKCEICGTTEWNGKPVPTVLDHIDGHSENHLLNNLRIVCPNCDAQLSTYKSKNNGNGRKYRRNYYKS